MRHFLYISPYFPPLSRTGALRPLKFARHLPQHGWAPVVLCDLWPTDEVDPELLDAVPDTTVVVRDYSRRARPAERQLQRRWREGGAEPAVKVRSGPQRRPLYDRFLPAWLNNPELIPLGEHSPRMPYATRRAREVLAKHRCEAIMVNADPYAATLVGARLARETGLPLVVDLRDPWGPCALRRPRRPPAIRMVEDRLEQSVVLTASKVILNTRSALDAYLDHYAGLDAERFTFIRNHYDARLIGKGSHPGFDRYTLLFLGNFGRFIKAEVVLQTLAELRSRGVGERELQIVVTGRFPESAWRMARGLGVQAMIHLHPHVPYCRIGAIMNAADMLVLLLQPGLRQRLASKYFDYLASERPILAIADSAEQAELLEETGAGVMLGHGSIEAIADHIQAEMALGRQRFVPRLNEGDTSEAASARLAAILDEVTLA